MIENKLIKAQSSDLGRVIEHYKSVINAMDREGIFMWDMDFYPTVNDLSNDIKNGEMLLVKNGDEIMSAAVLNSEQDVAYSEIAWEFECDKIAVIHRLCVNPKYQHMGVGRKTVALCEDYLKEQNYQSIRLDVFSENLYALKLYENARYKKRGETVFRVGKFYLYEKLLKEI